VVTIRLPREVWRMIRVEAASNDKSASEWLRERLVAWADRQRTDQT
jgi:hypothetical protein